MTQPSGNGFAEALLAALAGADPRREVERVLRQWAGERVYIPRRALRQRDELPADLARRLLAAGVGRAAVVAIVRDRRGVTARHARRLVAVALADMRDQTMS